MAALSAEVAPVRRRRWRKRLALLVALAVVGDRAYSLLDNWLARRAYGPLVADLDATDPGWRLADHLARRPDVPAAENAALVIELAGAKLPRPWILDDRLTGFDDFWVPPFRLDDKLLAVLDEELGRAADALTVARRLVDLPRGRFDVQWRGMDWLPSDPFGGQPSSTRHMISLLNLEAIRLAATGRPGEAVLLSVGTVNVGRALDGDPGMIPLLIRVGCRNGAAHQVEYALSQGEVLPEVLTRCQAAFAAEESSVTALAAYRMERAFLHACLEEARSSPIPPPEVQPEFYETACHAHVLRALTDAVEVLRAHPDEPWIELKPRLPDWGSDNLSEPNARRIILRFIAGLIAPRPRFVAGVYLSGMGPLNAKALTGLYNSRAALRAATCALAAERYRLERGQWPSNPTELVPAYLPEWPTDPFDGRPLRWLRRPDGLTVYSVGRDGRDDGGSVTPSPPKDTGFRLWDLDRRRQAPPAGKDSGREP